MTVEGASLTEIIAVPIELCRNFDERARCVSRVHSSNESDVLVVCWEPGQGSSDHHHGASESIMYVLEGIATVSSGDEEHRYGAGTFIITPRDVTHRVWNGERVRLVTLHVYAPKLEAPLSEPFFDLVAGGGRGG
jgi:quercetin dioxygenase-like cupin family protein